MIGIARPLCTHPNAVSDLLQSKIDSLPAYENHLHLRPAGLLSPASTFMLPKMINVLGAQGWYYQQMVFLAQGREPQLERGMLRSFFRYLWDEMARTLRMKR